MSYISFNIGGIVELYFLRKMVFALFARPSYGSRLNVGIAMLSFVETMENHHPSDTGWVMGAPEGKSCEIPDKTWITGGYCVMNIE